MYNQVYTVICILKCRRIIFNLLTIIIIINIIQNLSFLKLGFSILEFVSIYYSYVELKIMYKHYAILSKLL